MHTNVRIIKCPECGKPVKEITTFENGRIVENHAFCADDNAGDCLWGGAWPDNSRNIINCKMREHLKKEANDGKQ